MPTPRSTAAPVTTLRTRILDEALAILDEQGIAGVTVRAVAARSECSTIGVYTHFGGKEGLVEALLLEGFADFEAAVAVVDRDGADGPGSGVDRLRRGAHAYRDWARANRPRYLLMFSPGPPAPVVRAEVRSQGGRSRSAHEERVRLAIELGDLRPGEVGAVAAAVWAHVHGWVMLELTGTLDAGPEHDAREAFDDYVRALLDGLAPQGSGPRR